MNLFGLIGYPLSHSFSEQYFTNKFKQEKIINAVYKLFPLLNIYELPGLLDQHPQLKGLNITIPYKTSVMDLLDNIDPEAEEIGAINTLLIKNKKLTGYNTDVYGFSKSLKPLLQNNHNRALVLGTGGASRAVVFVLKQLRIPYKTVSRDLAKGNYTYPALSKEILLDHHIIINTTPLGTSPNTEQFPDIPYNFLTRQHLVYDLVYNPEKTVFLQKANEQSAQIKNGLEMLSLQAEKSWSIWNNM